MPDKGGVCNRKPFNEPPQTLGQWLRFWRMNAGLSQRQIAQMMGVPRRRIILAEADAILLKQKEINAIERAMGVGAHVLAREGQQ